MMRCKVKMKGGDEVKRLREARDEVKRLAPFADLPGEVYRVLGLPYGGPYMGRDADGEAFYPETQIWLNVGDERPCTYYHGFGPDDPYMIQETPAVIGTAKYVGADTEGHWFEVKLDPNEELAVRVLNAIGMGMPVRASSGAAGHLVRDGQGGLLDVWPVAELALFDINEWRLPANGLAILVNPLEEGAVTVDREMEDYPQMDMAEMDAEAGEVKRTIVQGSEAVVEVVANVTPTIQTDEPGGPAGDVTMEQNDIQALAEALKPVISEAVKAEVEKLNNEPTGMGGILAAKSGPGVKRNTELGFTQDATKGFMHWLRTGQKNGALIEPGTEWDTKAALQGQTDSEGGYLVPDDFYPQIVAKRNLLSWIAQAPVNRITTSLDVVPFPTESTAATKAVVTAEEGAYDENEPVFGQVRVTIHKFTKLVKISEELMADNKSGLEGYLASMFGRAKALAENYYYTIGSGTNEPQGILTGGTSALTSAGATAVTPAEMAQLIGALGAGYNVPSETGFLMKNASKWYLKGLTGNPFQFVSTPQGNDIMEYPVYASDDMEAIAATKKAILFANFQYYGFAEREGMVIQRNPWLYMANGQLGLFCKFRSGGAVLQAEAIQYITQHA